MKTKIQLLFILLLCSKISFAQTPVKISALPSAAVPCVGCAFPVVQAGATKKYSVSSLDSALKAYSDSALAANKFWTLRTSNNVSNSNSGNIGIGTTTPAYKLDVNGTTALLNHKITAYDDGSANFNIGVSGTPGSLVISDGLGNGFQALGSGALKINTGTEGVGKILTSDASGSATWQSPATNGTVTAFSANPLSPLFGLSVSNATTTPGLSFSLSNAAGKTVFGNASASSNTPAYIALDSSFLPGMHTENYFNTKYGAPGSGGGSAGMSASDSITQLGTIYSHHSWTGLTDFTDVGTGATISGTDINISGGSNTISDFLALKDTTLYSDWKFKVRFKINAAPSSTSYGIGIGVTSLNSPTQKSLIVKADLSTGGGAGKITMYAGSIGSPLSIITNGPAIVFSQNDSMELEIEKTGKYVSAYLQNLNTGSAPYTASYVYITTSVNPAMPNTGRFSIYRFGGNYNINAVNLISTTRKYAKFGFVGDSKTQYYSASEIYKGYPGLINTALGGNAQDLPLIANYGGGSDQTTDVLARLASIKNAKHQIIFLEIGCNDIRNGMPIATSFANYRKIVTGLTAGGAQVINLLPFPENPINLSAYKDSIIAAYPTTFIDTWNPLRNGTGLAVAYDAGDGSHLNDAGNMLVYRTILKSGILDTFIPAKTSVNMEAPIGIGGGNISSNLAVGVQSLYGNTTGIQNAAFGHQTLQLNSTGSYNTAIGTPSMSANTTGTSNTAVGVNSLLANTTGTNNTAGGVGALQNNVTGIGATAFGTLAAQTATAGQVTAFGYQAAKATGGNQNNAAFGYGALQTATGDYNTALGNLAMGASTSSAAQCVAVGYNAIGQVTSVGTFQTAVGTNALANSTGANNTTIGFQGGYANTSGAFNGFFGSQAGRYNTTASNQIILNTLDRTNYAGDQGGSPIYIVENATVASQTIALNGVVTSLQYRLSALNTAPSSATDTGTLGEIRITAGYMYVCTATNTWVRAALATW